MSLQTASGTIGKSHLETIQPQLARVGRLSRLLFKIRPLWDHSGILAKPRRSIDRELQEKEPYDLY